MTVFEKIKEMDIKQLSDFMCRASVIYDIFDNGYCNGCNSYFKLFCYERPTICPEGNDYKAGFVDFLETDYELLRSLLYGEEHIQID